MLYSVRAAANLVAETSLPVTAPLADSLSSAAPFTVRLEAVGIDLHVLKRSQHEADAFGLVLVGVHTRLAQPAPDGQHGLAVGDLGPHGIPVLGGGIRIDQPHGFGLVQELQGLLVDAALLGGGLHVLTVGGDEHGTLVGVAEPAADGCGVLHHIAVPILEQ